MLKFVKALHLIGVVLFFGSILGHITVGFVPGAKDDPQTALIAREAISVATTYLTMPGLVLLLLTGIFMIGAEQRASELIIPGTTDSTNLRSNIDRRHTTWYGGMAGQWGPEVPVEFIGTNLFTLEECSAPPEDGARICSQPGGWN